MRPSDDVCTYHFLIPANMFAIVALREISEIFENFFPEDTETIMMSRNMSKEIDDAIHKYAIVEKPDVGKIYAYEVDGCGNQYTIDDANVPSLLSIPYLNYTSPHDPYMEIYLNTRKFILSPKNDFFYQGKMAKGIGSKHTPKKRVWPMSIIMQALTTQNTEEINLMIDMLEKTDDGTNFMHESVDVDNPNKFSRPWFGWANSLFSELILEKIDVIQHR